MNVPQASAVKTASTIWECDKLSKMPTATPNGDASENMIMKTSDERRLRFDLINEVASAIA
jgi:hypothetical protein